MFEKLIALIILGIAIYNIYRIYERGKIRAELIKSGRKCVTHEEVLAEQNRRIHENMMESLRKLEEQRQQIEEIKNIEKETHKSKKEFRTFTAEEKREYAIKQRQIREQKVEKGAQYESFIAEHYRSLGYEVIEHGKVMKKKDAGIDLIAKNHKELIMIQCKNWKAGAKYTINHAMISAFVGNVEMFLAKHPEYIGLEIKRIFTVSEPILDKSALAQVNNNREMVRYEHIPMP